MTGRRATLLGLSFSLLIAGCASVPRDPAARAEFKANHDPLEPLNRGTFAFNLFVDRILIKPIAKGYVWALPQGGRDALRRGEVLAASVVHEHGYPPYFLVDLADSVLHRRLICDIELQRANAVLAELLQAFNSPGASIGLVPVPLKSHGNCRSDSA